jgi:FecR protein
MSIEARRRRLKQLAALGLLGPAGISGLIQEALAKGDLPAISGVNSLSGSATVNGQAAKVGTPVKPGDKVTTSNGSQAVVVVGKDAYLLRDRTTIVFEESKSKPGVIENVLVATGKVLSVFDKRSDKGVSIRLPTATVGIRGTGCYIEVHEGRSYFCLCYGEAAVEGPGMPNAAIIKTTHHENPVWLYDSGGIMKVEKAGFVNHNDDELIMLEKLNGREPPFVKLGLTGRY